MVLLGAVREVETWTAPDIVGGLVLLAVTGFALWRGVRRYLGL